MNENDLDYLRAFREEPMAPSSAIIDAMPGSQRFVWGEEETLGDTRRNVVPQGHMILFRQDLIHAGASKTEGEYSLTCVRRLPFTPHFRDDDDLITPVDYLFV